MVMCFVMLVMVLILAVTLMMVFMAVVPQLGFVQHKEKQQADQKC